MAYEFGQLLPELRPWAERLVAVAVRAGAAPQVTSTYRSASAQRKLYAKYLRGQTPYPVAPPGRSAHQFGAAFDMVVPRASDQNDLGTVWQGWGGIWGGARDPVHFELPGYSRALAGAPAQGPRKASRIAQALDLILAFNPVIGAVELAAWLVELGFGPSEITTVLQNPVATVW